MRVVTFGEAMLRFSPPAGSSLEKAEEYVVEVGGAEANVAVALARLGAEVRWVSRLPRTALGRRVAGKLREHGVHVQVIWSDEGRVGLYFVEMANSPRLPYVLYDRADSAFARVQPDEVGASLLDGAGLFHTSGITPALGRNCARATMRLMELAAGKGIPISFDVNYRARLWTAQEARAAVEQIVPLVRFLFVSHGDAALVLGVDGSPAEQVEELHARYPASAIIVTAGMEGAFAWDDGLRHAPVVPGVTVDRLGRGDAFCAGYLFGRMAGGPERALAYGAALASLAQTYSGDFAWITREDVERVVAGATHERFR